MQLFEVSQQIEINKEISSVGPTEHKSNDWSQPDYSAPFEFIFPSASNSCQCQLPPSLHMASSLVRIKVEYTLVVAVRQNMLCGVTRTKRVQRELSLRSEAGTVFLPSSTIGCLPANKLCPKMNNALQEAYRSRFTNPDWLPPYTPSLQVEVVLSSPPILTIGKPTQIQVVLHVPPELLEGENIYLRSAVMQLKSSVTTIVGTISGSSTETHDLWSCRGRVHLDKRRLELDSGTWGSCIVLDTWPTCTSCVLDLKHAIEVVAGISRGDDQEIQVTIHPLHQMNACREKRGIPNKRHSMFMHHWISSSWTLHPIIFQIFLHGQIHLHKVAKGQDQCLLFNGI